MHGIVICGVCGARASEASDVKNLAVGQHHTAPEPARTTNDASLFSRRLTDIFRFVPGTRGTAGRAASPRRAPGLPGRMEKGND